MTISCPSREELLALHRGALPEDRAQPLIVHLAECAACQTTTDSFGPVDDTVMARLRMPAPEEPFADEAPLQQALANVRAMADAPTTGGVAVAELSADAGPATVTFEPPAIELPQLGEYELLEKLGQGGMGAVYKARHRRLDKIVAVKVLPLERMADPLALARFDREMRAVGRLDHPNIVRAMDAREIGGTHFLAMEYVAGMDLGDVVLNVGATRVADACEVVRQIAAGLQCAHENGLVHRDIKPSNAILTPGGQVKLLDLGLARLGGGDANGDAGAGEMTTSGTAMGTADYMAPEQASDSHTADIRADIYSLGCTLYKLLSGKSPFSGPKYKNNMDKILGHMRDTPPPIGLLRTDVSADLAAVLDRMMAKEREARIATPQEVFDALLPFAVGANLPRLYREADAMQRGEPLSEPSVIGTEPGASSAVGDTARHLECGALSPLLSKSQTPANIPGSGVNSPAPSRDPHVLSSPRRPLSASPRLLLTALAFFAFAVLAGVIVIRIVQKSGKETIVEVPEGDLKSVTIEDKASGGTPTDVPRSAAVQSGDKAPHSKMPIGVWVPLVTSEADLKAWQTTGPGAVTFDDGAVRVENATVTYPTLAVDLVIRVQIQVEINVQPTARLLLRETPAGSYAAVLEDGTKLVLGVTEGEKWRELKSAPVTVAAGQPLALEFAAVGNVLTVSLNGKPAIEVQDSTHSYGAPGLAATDGATTFRNVDVKVVRRKEVDLAKTTERPQVGTPATSPSSVPAGPSVAQNDLPPWNFADDAPPPAIAPFDPKQARQHQDAWAKHLGIPVEETNSIGMKLVILPPGEYGMGLTAQEFQVFQEDLAKANLRASSWYTDGLKQSTPKRTVRLFRPFQVGAYEVTLDQFRQFVLESGYKSTGEQAGLLLRLLPDESYLRFAGMSWRHPTASSTDSNQPVVKVSLDDANAFADWLSCKESRDYRLPTEEEWEDACRAGGDLKYGFVADIAELSDLAWLDDTRKATPDGSQAVPHAVGLKRANPFGSTICWEMSTRFVSATHGSFSWGVRPFLSYADCTLFTRPWQARTRFEFLIEIL